MILHGLATEFTGNKENYCVVNISFKCLKSIINEDIDERFPINELIEDLKMEKLKEFLKLNIPIIPPELRHLPSGKWIVFDGQHRFGMARYLKLDSIPFLILKSQISILKQMNFYSIELQ